MNLFIKPGFDDQNHSALTSDELRVAVSETAGLIPDRHKDMLLGILDLERSRLMTLWCRAVKYRE